MHRAAAEKFKVPTEPSALVPESTPGPLVRPECEEEEEEEEEEEVRPRDTGGPGALGALPGEGAAPEPACSPPPTPPRWTRQGWSSGTSSW